MTLKDHKNHYNIKFLKGYGFSINVKDSKIILKNNYDPFKEPEAKNSRCLDNIVLYDLLES
jgi:CRISPR-associated protein Cas1